MKKKILIVEDSFEVRIALETAFDQEGYEVHAVVDAESGEELFGQIKPDLALLDVRLPGMSGIELCAIIRESSAIPVIIFSAVEEIAEKISAFSAGADDYVLKGTGVDELLARVAVHLKWERRPAVDADEEENTSLFVDVFNRPPIETPNEKTEPRAKESPLPAAVPKRRPKLPKRQIAVQQYDGMVGTAILVADPDPEARNRLTRLLKRMGHDVIEAENGRQTLKTIGRYSPWLLFCELVMPDMNGMRMLELLKNHPKTKDLAVIVVAKDGSPDKRWQANHLGALDYIDKPWADHEIELRIKWVREAIERRALQRSESEESDSAA